MTLRASWEPIAGIIRVRQPGASDTDPFEVAVTVVCDHGTAIIKALRSDNLTPAHAAAIRDCLRAQGFVEAIWHRPGPLPLRATRTKL